MIQALSALVAGTVFGVGLTLAGMTDPAKVLAFLTLDHNWDPTLMFVLASAVLTTAIGYALTDRRAAPLFDAEFHAPASKAIDQRLLAGAALFGFGWGLAGYCPGPAIVGAFVLDPRAWVFAAGLMVGMLVFERLPTPSKPQPGSA